MSKDEYYVEPDHDGDLTLWVDDTPIVATLENGGLFVQDSHPRHERAVWRAAASVLAPDDDTVLAAAKAIHAAYYGRDCWDALPEIRQKLWIVGIKAVFDVLRDRAVSD